MTSERLFSSFIPPKNLYPQNKFLATPLICSAAYRLYSDIASHKIFTGTVAIALVSYSYKRMAYTFVHLQFFANHAAPVTAGAQGLKFGTKLCCRLAPF